MITEPIFGKHNGSIGESVSTAIPEYYDITLSMPDWEIDKINNLIDDGVNLDFNTIALYLIDEVIKKGNIDALYEI